MKHLKNLFAFFVILGSFLTLSCSDEAILTSETTSSLKSKEQINLSFSQREESNSEVSEYLTSFYKKDFSYRESIETYDDEGYYIVTEVIVDKELSARGYVVVDKNSGDFLYFVDVDRINYVLTAVNIATSETILISNINSASNYESTNGFDFMKIIEEYNNDSTTKRRFWGWQCNGEIEVGGQCYRFCEYFTIFVSHGGESYPCNDLPGSNPKFV